MNTKLILLSFCVLFFSCQEKPKHLFILSGQSNMVRMNPEISFIPKLASELGRDNIIIVKNAKGSQAISRWYKKWKSPAGFFAKNSGDLYDVLLKKVRDSVKKEMLKSITFIWMQGERDARLEFGEVYEESLLGLYQQLSDDLERNDLNFIIGRLSDFDLENSKWPHWTKIREAQMKVGNSNSRFAWVNTDDLNTGLDIKGQQVKDDLHLAQEGYKVLGERFAGKAIELIRKYN